MGLKISANSLLQRHYLIVDSGGVKYYDGTSFFGSKRLPFSRVDCVLMSPDHKLSLQFDNNEVFSIATKPNNAKHQTVIQALLQEVRKSAGPGVLQ